MLQRIVPYSRRTFARSVVKHLVATLSSKMCSFPTHFTLHALATYSWFYCTASDERRIVRATSTAIYCRLLTVCVVFYEPPTLSVHTGRRSNTCGDAALYTRQWWEPYVDWKWLRPYKRQDTAARHISADGARCTIRRRDAVRGLNLGLDDSAVREVEWLA